MSKMCRLTKRHGKHAVQIGGETRRNDIGWLRLAQYEDLEEQGRLIELPCAVGDTVWMIIDNRDYKRRMKGVYPPAEELPGLSITETKFDLLCLVCMGKTIFLTKEEAEAKLKELEGDKECQRK